MYNPQHLRVVVYLKLPIPGLAKTRLAQDLGMPTATNLYRSWVPRFVRKMVTIFSDEVIELSLAPPENSNQTTGELYQALIEWIQIPLTTSIQSGNNLSQRLTQTFNDCFTRGFRQVVIVGSDSPQLTETDLHANLALLQIHDLVLGPAEDGGYYLIGLKQPPGNLLEQVRWSCAQTLTDTVHAAQKCGMSVGMGPVQYDLDTGVDVDRLLREDVTGEWDELRQICLQAHAYRRQGN